MPGQEFAGIIEEVGSKVTALKVGDAVLGHKIPFRVRYR
jgi:NADPH:quinone reductase-like Zn-dependent oxidoreductase